ncbi:TPA: hypothetical protein DIC38_00800 [Candidatus Nomurabacteria bacterium]|nr:MAG: hypothetical protein O210_OD1C00001G0567 [Parcubacteria bacterium RAAC4_OD1_1]HCY26210.1 hypothetical protein [Candidatus Nomurabacteria bacterium]
MSLKTKIFLLISIIVGVFTISNFSNAEQEIMVLESDINVETIPENPEPYQDITIILKSYATDLNKAKIEWLMGSSVVLSGIGKTKYSFTAPGPNETTTFSVSITPQNSISNILKKISINPSEIELIWEAVDSYTPPFYKGKSFASREGKIKVVAIPNTNTIKSGKGSVSYTWKYGEGENTDQNASGYGKDYFIIKNKALNTKEYVKIIASSVDGKYNATKKIEIPLVNSKILFYKKSPTEGVLYSEAIKDDSYLEEDEITLVAEPYFFSIENPKSIVYNWKVNNKSIDTPSKKTEVTLRPASRGGYATIGLTMEDMSALFQKVTSSIKINL